ncbi:hypothetical protein, partial [Parafilimonas sp.]|uniref:hypothetical protein n=1 Tax=Parafilimonas sp. TaxID=1969739 RepID=UPI0039E4899D
NAVYIFKSDGWNSYDMFNPMIYVDGKLMTIDEINAAYSKKDVLSVTSKNKNEVDIATSKNTKTDMQNKR